MLGINRLLPLLLASLTAGSAATETPMPFLDRTALRVSGSTAFEYRLGAVYRSPARPDRPQWYLETHLDTALLGEGFNPLNLGLELGFRVPDYHWLAFGAHLEQPLYTDNQLVGLSTTVHSPVIGSRLSAFASLQLLYHRRPVADIGDFDRRRFYNLQTGIRLQLGKTP